MDAQGCLRGFCQLKGQPTVSQNLAGLAILPMLMSMHGDLFARLASKEGSPLVQRVCRVLKMESHHQLWLFYQFTPLHTA